MDPLKTHCILLLSLASCLVSTVQPEGESSASTTGTYTGSTSLSPTASSTSPENPSVTDTLTSTNPSSADSADDSTSNTATGASEDSTGTTGEPNGFYPCTTDGECASGHCYAMGVLGGVCSECDADEDCVDVTGFGCNPPDIAGPVLPAVCGDGELGSGCEDSTACADGLTCEEVLTIPAVDQFTHCSSCATHDDCRGEQLCAITIDITTISGFWSCIEPGSVEIGGTCDHDGDGDLACASGNCAEADIDNLAFMGLCSECDEDSDCADGSHCQPADIDTFDVMGIPAVCVQD
jgi:hypothetical protein